MSSYCSQCGTGLPLGAQFCPKCGTQIAVSSFGRAAPSQPAQPQPAYQPTTYTPQYAYQPAGPQRSAWEWMTLPLKRYADFSGRSQRQEYWMFYLLNMIVICIFGAFMLAGIPWSEMQTNSDAQPGPMFFVGLGLLVLWILAMFIPSLAVAVRRFHDQDKSGWFYLLSFIPYAGGIILIIFMCIDGTRGPNQYGPDPKGMGNADIFS